jgi:hypothetical protein
MLETIIYIIVILSYKTHFWGHTTKPVSIGRIVPDKTETHVESIAANVFSRELLRPIDNGFVV